MSDNLPRTNRWLIALSVILCLILGGIFTRSSAVTSQADAISDTGAFVSEDQDSAEFTSEETLTDSNDNFTDSSSGKLFGRTSSDSSETSPGGPALSTDISLFILLLFPLFFIFFHKFLCILHKTQHNQHNNCANWECCNNTNRLQITH